MNFAIGKTAAKFIVWTIAIVSILGAAPSALADAKDDAKARGQFDILLRGINDRNFEPIKNAFNKKDLTTRIYAVRLVDSELKKEFNSSFWETVEAAFMDGLPAPNSGVEGAVVGFTFQDGKGNAVVRFPMPNYEFGYQVFELQHNSRARLKVIDWHDTNKGHSFVDEVAEVLMTAMPTRASTRQLLSIANPSDRQLFQATEIFKAVRDKQAQRFFDIYDDLGGPLKREPLIAKYATYFSYFMQDVNRFNPALETFVDVYASNPDYGLIIADLYFAVDDYEQAYVYMKDFHDTFHVEEGALPARLSALALALQNIEDAEKYGLEAATVEPSLELAWWSLLRANAGAGNFAAATDALTHLEDDFGHHLDIAKLKRDRFEAFLDLADSQEFKDWRAAR